MKIIYSFICVIVLLTGNGNGTFKKNMYIKIEKSTTTISSTILD